MSSDPTKRGTSLSRSRQLWDRHASWWSRTYTKGADVEYAEEILPLVAGQFDGRRRVLDIGCGEGQVSRLIASSIGRGVVCGLDPSGGQLEHAARDKGVSYAQGAGEALPFADDSFDGVICCLAIEHCEDVDRVLDEVARVLAPGGMFLLLINHPLYQGVGSGFVDDQILGEQYWRVGPYLTEAVVDEQIDRGVVLPFAHRPLSRYLNPLARHDLLLVEMYEPPPLESFLEGSVNPELELAIPRLLAMRFEHRPRVRALPAP